MWSCMLSPDIRMASTELFLKEPGETTPGCLPEYQAGLLGADVHSPLPQEASALLGDYTSHQTARNCQLYGVFLMYMTSIIFLS